MVLNVGLVSACIVYKNRAGAQTRLQKLERKLAQKPIYHKTLYSYPVKKIFSIFIIVCFMAGLLLFLNQLQLQINQKHKGVNADTTFEQTQLNRYIFPYRPQNLIEHLHNSMSHHANYAIMKSLNDQKQYQKVQRTIYWLLVFFTIPIMVLLFSLDFERVIVKAKSRSQSDQISGNITIQRLTLLAGWVDVKQLVCKATDSLFIQLCGQMRFSNTNFYYAIKKINKPQETQDATKNSINESKAQQINEEVIMQKGNIYEARQALIYICHILKKDLNLSIKNGPVKEKPKTSKTSKRANKQK